MTHPSFEQAMARISVQELAERLAGAAGMDPTSKIQLIDVREPQEVAIASLPAFDNFPLSEFAVWSGQIHDHLDAEVETLVLCHHGFRSAQVCQWLMAQGFSNVKNITGGIDAYANIVDSSIPKY